MPKQPPVPPSTAPARLWPRAAAVVAAGLVTGSTQSGALLPVSATVASRTALSVRAPATVVISAEDLARGFVDVAEPAELRIVSNDPRGLALEVRAPRGLFQAMHVAGRDIDATLPGEGGTLAYRWQPPAASAHTLTLTLALRFRFMPAPGVTPGVYAWPVDLQGRALDTGPAQ